MHERGRLRQAAPSSFPPAHLPANHPPTHPAPSPTHPPAPREGGSWPGAPPRQRGSQRGAGTAKSHGAGAGGGRPPAPPRPPPPPRASGGPRAPARTAAPPAAPAGAGSTGGGRRGQWEARVDTGSARHPHMHATTHPRMHPRSREAGRPARRWRAPPAVDTARAACLAPPRAPCARARAGSKGQTASQPRCWRQRPRALSTVPPAFCTRTPLSPNPALPHSPTAPQLCNPRRQHRGHVLRVVLPQLWGHVRQPSLEDSLAGGGGGGQGGAARLRACENVLSMGGGRTARPQPVRMPAHTHTHATNHVHAPSRRPPGSVPGAAPARRRPARARWRRTGPAAGGTRAAGTRPAPPRPALQGRGVA